MVDVRGDFEGELDSWITRGMLLFPFFPLASGMEIGADVLSRL